MEKNLKIYKGEGVSYSITREIFNLNEDISKKEVEKNFQTIDTETKLELVKISNEIQNKMGNPVHTGDTFNISENILKSFSSKDNKTESLENPKKEEKNNNNQTQKIEDKKEEKTSKVEDKKQETSEKSSKIKIEAHDDFNYKSPSYNKDGHLKSREDLYNPEQVEDGYSSVKELFTKLNSMAPTQIEPLIKPYYYGEVDEKGEKIPTFIIVGDVHADEYNLTQKEIEAFKTKKFLIEKNENFKAETEVLSLLNKKFKINNFGIEGDLYGESFKTKIGKETKKLGLKSFGIEKLDTGVESDKIMLNQIVLSFSAYKSLGVDINTNFLENEVPKYEEYIIKQMQKYGNKDEKEAQIDSIKSLKNLSKEELILSYKANKYFIYKSFLKEDKETENFIINEAKKSNKNFEQILKEFSDSILNMDKILIEKRNSESIEIVSKEMGKDKMMVLVYGKAHSEDLMKQLKEKYNGKVNIYVAK